MIERVDKNNLEEYESFIKTHPKGLFMHSSKWSKVKSAWKWEAILDRADDGRIRGSAAVLIREMPVVHASLLYCCRGFVCDPDDTATFDRLFDGLLKLAKEYHGYCLKIDPEISVENTAFKAHLLKKGFTEQNPGCLDFENVQPKFVYCFDYAGKTEDELMLQFKPDYRNRIRKAGRKGVEVKVMGKEALDDFTAIMKETGERDGFSTRPKSYFASIMDNLGDDCRLYMAYYEGKAIAGTLAIRWGKNVMKYQYGASSNAHRNVYPNYLLQWEMIRWGLESGCRVYDFGGISGDIRNESNPHYGLWRFKHGFNGYMVEFVGEYDYVIQPLVYKAYNTAIKLRSKLHR